MSLVTEVLVGLYLGLLAGVIPALIAGVLGFVFKYVTGVSIPALAVVVLATAVAGINGGLMGLLQPEVLRAERFVVALLIVMMLALYAHSQGDKLGAGFPRRLSLRKLRERTLSTEAISFASGFGEVTITARAVEDMEGYPPLSPELRQELLEGSWTFPADVPLGELEVRLADRLTTDYDLADVVVSIDAGATAKIVSAPAMSGLSRRVPDGHRAVSVSALVPTGVVRGEAVTVGFDGRSLDATLLSAKSDPKGAAPARPTPPTEGDPIADGGTLADGGEETDVPKAAPSTTGGEGRVTLSVPRSEATALLAADRGRIHVRSRGTRREYELVSLLRRSGKRFAKVPVRPDSRLDGVTVGSPTIREELSVAILAVRHPVGAGATGTSGSRWEFTPAGGRPISAGDDLFVVGTAAAVTAATEAGRGGGS